MMSYNAHVMTVTYRFQVDPAITWADVAAVVGSTHLPIICKGILTVNDAQQAVKAGAKVCDHIIPHHITSYHITSHHITSHHITPHHTTSHAQGIIVSNHGWRQMDGFPSSISVLKDIVDAVGDQIEVCLSHHSY